MSRLPGPPRAIAVGLVLDEDDRILLARMPPDRGVFPGRWSLPGGGMEPGELAVEALRRELREEVGLEVVEATPLFFRDGLFDKRRGDGRTERRVLVFLCFACRAHGRVRLNEEFDDHRWLARTELEASDLDDFTRETLTRAWTRLDELDAGDSGGDERR